ncbi:MAG TPA: hypothetical protein VLT81_03055 [Chondromyces sp.]|nr:hypothetical protein [Chondromyces sp.]
MPHAAARFAATVLATVFILGCAREAVTVAPEPLIPDTPDGTVLAVAKHLADHDPSILWEALPETYRTDINELTRVFAAKMDPELYNRSMALARRTVEVLQDKQAIILGSQTVASTGVDVAEVERGMNGGLAVAHALLSSEITTLEGLGAVDWSGFLSGTGRQLMLLADNAAPAAEPEVAGEDLFAALRTLTVETVSISEDSAMLRITAADEEPEEVAVTRVEGRWVPAEMAAEWPQKVAEARARLEELTPEKIAELKPQAMFGLAMAEAFVEQMAAIESSEQFDAAVGPMLQSVMGSLAFAPPPAGEASQADDEPVQAVEE